MLWPFLLLFVAAVGVLTAWTVEEGFDWVLVETNETTGETMGKCQGINSVEYFTPVFLLTVTPVLLTAIMAWKTRDVDSTYSESKWIFGLIAIHLQILVVSIPVLAILEGRSSNARYMGQVTIFFFYPMTTIGLIIGPKAYALHLQPKATRGASNGQTRISGLTPPSASSASGAENPNYAKVPALRKRNSHLSSQNDASTEIKHAIVTFSQQDDRDPTPGASVPENEDIGPSSGAVTTAVVAHESAEPNSSAASEENSTSAV